MSRLQILLQLGLLMKGSHSDDGTKGMEVTIPGFGHSMAQLAAPSKTVNRRSQGLEANVLLTRDGLYLNECSENVARMSRECFTSRWDEFIRRWNKQVKDKVVTNTPHRPKRTNLEKHFSIIEVMKSKEKWYSCEYQIFCRQYYDYEVALWE